MLTIIFGVPIIYLALYWTLQPSMPAWSNFDRGFRTFENQWKTIFGIVGLTSLLLGLGLNFWTQATPATSLTVSVIAGLLLLAAYTDSVVGKVPREISYATTSTAAILGIGTLLINSVNMENFQRFYTTIPLVFAGQEWVWLGGGVAVFLIFFLAWLKTHGVMTGILSMFVASIGLWVALSAGMSLLTQLLGITGFGDDVFWRNVLVYGLPSMLIVVLIVVAFDLGAGMYHLGGADTQSMYAAGWGFAGIVGGITIGYGVLVASVLQLVLHTLVRPLKLPVTMKQVPLTPMTRTWYRVTGRKELATRETRAAASLPFLPVLNFSVVVATVVTVMFFPTVM